MAESLENVPKIEHPLCDDIAHLGVAPEQEGKAKAAFVDVPVTLDPHYDRALEEPYLLQIFSSLEILGEGYFGTVYKARHKFDNKTYAVKKLKSEKISDAEKLKEIRNFEKVGCHPHIVNYIMGWEEGAEIYLMMQVSQTSLANYIKITNDVPEFVFWDCIHDVCLASMYMAEKRLVHYDVKDDNILIHRKHFKLADFGTVVEIKEDMLDEKCLVGDRWISRTHEVTIHKTQQRSKSTSNLNDNDGLWQVSCDSLNAVELGRILFCGSSDIY
ncbi:membrane-associated tyrosine- and threonine-specific cdc2-inhibitory kinase-like [Diabrotica virgifera virgifera]|uniref:non-specific serine/threonine protein kinase n=1 Tax=Diabrotica virgifera virgifera TaxID=50390 RepID=A0A6P7GET5_DIAVI|nr:membrane-associated tyrosine- and threonine-specific cdc2-inhibitory kinase-like [Diabrotica virgifera virgifera]